MYDCKDIMAIKMELLHQLDIPEHILKLYLPGEAPSAPIKKEQAIEVLRYIKHYLNHRVPCIDDLLCVCAACPYCKVFPRSCSDCPYGNKFGSASSKRYAKLKDAIYEEEAYWGVTYSDVTNAITFLNEKIEELEKCGPPSKN